MKNYERIYMFCQKGILNLCRLLQPPINFRPKNPRRISFILVFVVVVVNSVTSQKVNNNTQEGETLLKFAVKNGIKNIGVVFTEGQEQQIVDCIYSKIRGSKFEKKSGVLTTEVNELLRKISKDCAITVLQNQRLKGWSADIEGWLADSFFRDKNLISAYPEETNRRVVVKCIINKLKEEYPNGVDFKDARKKASKLYKDCL